jgi:hypothetical protein
MVGGPRDVTGTGYRPGVRGINALIKINFKWHLKDVTFESSVRDIADLIYS